MHKAFYLPVVVFSSIFFVFLSSCKKNDSHTTDDPPGTLSTSRATIRLDTTVSSTDTFIVHSTVSSWTATTVPTGTNWFKLDKASGGKGDSVITITILANNGITGGQTASVIFTATDNNAVQPVTVNLMQRPYTVAVNWQKTFGGSGNDLAIAVTRSPDGGFVYAGGTDSQDGDVPLGTNGGEDFWMVKLDASGNKLWAKNYGGSGSDQAYAVAATTDGGYVAAGVTYSNDKDVVGNHGATDWWVVKVDGSGNKLWAKTFGSTGSFEWADGIVATSDGGVALTGSVTANDGDVSGVHTAPYNASDAWVLKLDASGNIQWAKAYGGTGGESGYAIVNSSDGGFVVCGTATSSDGDLTGNYGNDDLWVFKIDGSGNKVWSKNFGGSDDDEGAALVATADGGYLAGGYASSTDKDAVGNHGSQDVFVVKLDGSGNKQWSKVYGGTGSDQLQSIVAVAGGGYVLASYTMSNNGDVTGNHGGWDFWITGITGSGSKQWAKTMGGTALDNSAGIVAADDGKYVIVGLTESSDGDLAIPGNKGLLDAWIVEAGVQ